MLNLRIQPRSQNAAALLGCGVLLFWLFWAALTASIVVGAAIWIWGQIL